MGRAFTYVKWVTSLLAVGLAAGCGSSSAEGLGTPGDSGADSTAAPAPDAGGLDGSPKPGSDAAAAAASDGGGCGYRDAGVTLHVASGVDLCLPKVACTAETCPPQLGDWGSP